MKISAPREAQKGSDSGVVDGSALGLSDKVCPCGKPLRKIRALRRSPGYASDMPQCQEIDALRCDACQRNFLEPGLVFRLVGVLGYTLLALFIMFAVISVPLIFVESVFELASTMELGAWLMWAALGLVAGLFVWVLGRSIYRRAYNAFVLKIVETDRDFYLSI